MIRLRNVLKKGTKVTNANVSFVFFQVNMKIPKNCSLVGIVN